MAMNQARIKWVEDAMNAARRLVELRDDLKALRQQHFLGLYGDGTTGILDADLQAHNTLEHITAAEIATWIAEINGLLDAMSLDGENTDTGNTPVGASLLLIG